MPTETKNVALKRICSGMISPNAWWLNRLSLTSRPARNAPSDRLTPATLVSQAVPKQIAMTVSRKSSGEHVRATRSSSGGINRRATSSTARMIASALPSAQMMASADPPVPPSIGTSSTITTIARSWKMSSPRLTCPNVVFDSPRSPSSFRTMAVDESETRNPVKSAGPPVHAKRQQHGHRGDSSPAAPAGRRRRR